MLGAQFGVWALGVDGDERVVAPERAASVAATTRASASAGSPRSGSAASIAR